MIAIMILSGLWTTQLNQSYIDGSILQHRCQEKGYASCRLGTRLFLLVFSGLQSGHTPVSPQFRIGQAVRGSAEGGASLKKYVPPTIAAVCVRVCVSKLPLLQRLSPDSLNAVAFRTPPPFLQSHARTKRGSCRHPSLLHVPESVSLQQGSKFLCD